MDYSVDYSVDLSHVPHDVLERLSASLAEIGDSISTIAPASPFWVSIDASLFELRIGDWRFWYMIDRHKHALLVVRVEYAERKAG